MLAAIGVVTLIIADLHRRRGVVAGPATRSAPVGGIVVLGLAAGGLRRRRAGGRRRRAVVAGGRRDRRASSSRRSCIDTLGAALKLPDWVLDLSLYKHLGQPMAGIFDPVGIVVAAVLVVGGLAICAIGLTRRDIGR